MKRITVYLTEQQIAAIQERAAQTGLKWAEVLRRMIDRVLQEERQGEQRKK